MAASITDEDIERQWQRLQRLRLAQLNDGGYMFALVSPSNDNTNDNDKVPNVDRFLSRKMTKEEIHEQLLKINSHASSCPTSGNQIVQAPTLDKLVDIKKLD